MHYQVPHSRGFGGFVVLPIKPKPATVYEPRTPGWLTSLFSNPKAAK